MHCLVSRPMLQLLQATPIDQLGMARAMHKLKQHTISNRPLPGPQTTPRAQLVICDILLKSH